MNKRALTKCIAMISAVIMTGCSSSNTPDEASGDTLSAEVTTVSETTVETTLSETTTAEETTVSETSAETTVTEETLSESTLDKHFKTDLDINDFDEFAASLTMYGGKYITVVPVFSEYCFVYENGELSEFDIPILDSGMDGRTVERISLADAERLAAPAPN